MREILKPVRCKWAALTNYISLYEFNSSIICILKIYAEAFIKEIGSGNNLDLLPKESRYNFVKGSICDRELLEEIFRRYRITSIVNFAAESHVDNSIYNPAAFIDANIRGTTKLLNCLLYTSPRPRDS